MISYKKETLTLNVSIVTNDEDLQNLIQKEVLEIKTIYLDLGIKYLGMMERFSDPISFYSAFTKIISAMNDQVIQLYEVKEALQGVDKTEAVSYSGHVFLNGQDTLSFIDALVSVYEKCVHVMNTDKDQMELKYGFRQGAG